ncbi:class I SAM-dependent methyltransferase [Pedobacter punctiformis]|uniref:SAM-dependent methyltransferase n=1 Tax=Pedobacter punctiformis TaxID=3004097 RepID=A0ABT4L3P9_9SPHI|nr:SAM-dependent methyltransferase [Pedobacter sp. HCMS5-2]MCZ4242542.1 SAM-dependent methyltransferase [Pedobacter sp. HCMS5-2]
MGNYQGDEADLKQILIRSVEIKREAKLAFTFRYKTRDIVKNFAIEEGLNLLSEYLTKGFKVATLFTTQADFIFEIKKDNHIVIRETAPVTKEKPSVSHDKQKQRQIGTTEKQYLVDLKITDDAGAVFKNAQDKYKQINHYIEILSPLIKEVPDGEIKHVVDMGSGKGYLTFALYDYLHQVLNLNTKITGVEYRQDMVDLCNQIAAKSKFDELDFVQGTIQDYDAGNIDLLIALHACDTATDDAIYKGIKADAKLIVVAPCCHKQIRREIEKNKVSNDVSFLTKYGIFLERQAEMVTDGIRALILEYFGYKTKVFEFISDAHTPKNVLVVGVKKAESLKTKAESERQAEVLEKIKDSKAYFGIGHHHLEKLLNL